MQESHAVLMYGGLVLETDTVTNDLWEYSLAEHVWKKLLSSGSSLAVVGHTAHIIRDQMFVFFGHNPTFGYLNNIQIYSLSMSCNVIIIVVFYLNAGCDCFLFYSILGLGLFNVVSLLSARKIPFLIFMILCCFDFECYEIEVCVCVSVCVCVCVKEGWNITTYFKLIKKINQYLTVIRIMIYSTAPQQRNSNCLVFIPTVTKKWQVIYGKGVPVNGGYGHSSVYDPISDLVYIHGGYISTSYSLYALTDMLYVFNPSELSWYVPCIGSVVYIQSGRIDS